MVVVSDTHVPRFQRGFSAVLDRLRREAPDAIVHCGDFTTIDIVPAFEEIAPFDAVAGNNDGPDIVERFGRAKAITASGRRLGLVHGDGEARAATRERAEASFAGTPLDAICFGHSHVPLCELRGDGTYVINPGSPLDKRRQPHFSYAVIDIDDDGVRPRLVYF